MKEEHEKKTELKAKKATNMAEKRMKQVSSRSMVSGEEEGDMAFCVKLAWPTHFCFPWPWCLLTG